MKVIADICIVPIGVGVSVSSYVAAAQVIFQEAGLNPQLHSYGTNVEGDYDLVFAAFKKCHETIHDMGAPRISSTIKFGTRIDREQTMDDKVKSVQKKLNDNKK